MLKGRSVLKPIRVYPSCSANCLELACATREPKRNQQQFAKKEKCLSEFCG